MARASAPMSRYAHPFAMVARSSMGSVWSLPGAHMTVAFGWLISSIAMLLLIFSGLGIEDEEDRRGVFATAAYLDDNLLADSSFMTVYTGLMAGLSQWGYLTFWWVTVKLALALTCALTGRQMFTRWLADASTGGDPIPGDQLVAATVLMITAITIMAWIARTKPWGRISTSRGRRSPGPSRAVPGHHRDPDPGLHHQPAVAGDPCGRRARMSRPPHTLGSPADARERRAILGRRGG